MTMLNWLKIDEQAGRRYAVCLTADSHVVAAFNTAADAEFLGRQMRDNGTSVAVADRKLRVTRPI